MNQSLEFTQLIAKLLEKAGYSTQILSLEGCQRGGNNRTFRLVTPEGVFAVKKYFRQAGDARDRLASEFSFLTYAQHAARDMVPVPYARDAEEGIALYEFINGTPLKPGDITDKEITQAIHFFQALNAEENRSNAASLPLASEACFSLQEHLDLIQTRIHSLQQIDSVVPQDLEAIELISRLSDAWQTMMNAITQGASRSGMNLSSTLIDAHRCISPSDFGFHNALKISDGSLRFLDFEYAGWDDPAKMTGDFFSQLAIPVPKIYFDRFVQEVMQPFLQADELINRAQLLRSVYQVKWCCIALNVFIPVNLARRRFANPDLNVVNLKQTQLQKAQLLLHNLEISHYG